MRRAIVCCLLVLAPPSVARGEPTIGILPVVGPKSIAEQLNPALGRAVAAAGQHEVLGPLEIQARLAGMPGVQLALREARETIQLSEQQELRMNRTAAVAAARKAITMLRAARASYHQPRLLARAQTALALALLLDPADRAAAQMAFREAFAADPHYQPNLDRIPPKNVQLLQQAAEQGIQQRESAIPLPDRSELADLAARIDLRGLVWIGIHQGGESKPTVRVLVYDGQAAVMREGPRRQLAPDQLLARTAELVVEALGGQVTSRPASLPSHLGASTDSPPPPPPRPRPTPWYKRWWVWSLAGAVVVGAGASAAVLITRDAGQSQSRYEYHFHF